MDAACQAPLAMGFSRQEYWSGLSCHPPRDLPDSWIKLTSLMSPTLAGRLFNTSATWEALQQSQTSVYERSFISPAHLTQLLYIK